MKRFRGPGLGGPRRFADMRGLTHVLAPSGRGVLRMLADLEVHYGKVNACAMVGPPARQWDIWKAGVASPGGAARRAIWVTWCWTFHRDRLWQFMDWITWGRVRMRPVPRPGRFVEDYQI